MMDDKRSMGLIHVIVWFLGVLFSLWIFVLVLGQFLEPLREIALNSDAVQSEGYDSIIAIVWPILSMWSGLLLAVGAICLMIIYAVFREQFRGTRRPYP